MRKKETGSPTDAPRGHHDGAPPRAASGRLPHADDAPSNLRLAGHAAAATGAMRRTVLRSDAHRRHAAVRLRRPLARAQVRGHLGAQPV
eukprot:scaffold97376_cov63-Phaeocystis_antarctica.AAC.2